MGVSVISLLHNSLPLVGYHGHVEEHTKKLAFKSHVDTTQRSHEMSCLLTIFLLVGSFSGELLPVLGTEVTMLTVGPGNYVLFLALNPLKA